MSVTFAPAVERWRKSLTKLASWVPVDFLLAWVDKESRGLPHVVSPIGERGLFQVHEDEKTFLKIPDADFMRLTTDPALAMRIGIRQAKTYAAYAKRFLADVGVEWHGRDFWKLVKLHHAAFGMPKYALLAFQRQNGRGPQDWQEFMRFALDAATRGENLAPADAKLSAKLRAITVKVFSNADEVGQVVPPSSQMEAVAFRQLAPGLFT